MGRIARGSQVDRALVEACLGSAADLPSDAAAVADFVAGARFHRIAPLAHAALQRSRPDIADQLRRDRDRALLNHLQMTARLGALSRQLEGIEWVVFKGPMLSEFAHPIRGLRFYKDLDLLVSPGDFRATCERLLEGGWRIVFGNESLQSEEFPGEIPLINEQGIVIDLHWSMQVMKSVRGHYAVTADQLLARRVPVEIGPVALSALDPLDALVHVCQHAALAGATRLGHLLDADQLARGCSDWDELAARARQWRASVQVAAVLLRARQAFDTPLPPDLAQRLDVGGALAKAMALLDRGVPAQTLRRDESWVRLATRSLRPTLAQTVGVGVRRGVLGVADRFRRPAPTQPRSTPDQRVIDAYLTRVEATAR